MHRPQRRIVGDARRSSATPLTGRMVVLELLFLPEHRGARADAHAPRRCVFLAAGIVRVLAAFHDPLFRVPLVFSGVASTILGLVVLLDLFDATYVLLGHCLASTPWSTGSR
jgi:membrane protein HdeD